jgi:hypothetical protein
MDSIQFVSEAEGFVIINNGQKLMSLFGDIPMWFETETEARGFWSAQSSKADDVRAAIQSLKSNLHFKTGDPMHFNLETITETLNSDALFYPYAGPEQVDQSFYFQPIRNYLDKIGFIWTDIDRSGPYQLDEASTILNEVEGLNMTQKSKLFYLMLNTENLFVAPLAYLKGSITEEEFLQAWMFNNGNSTRSNSKAYQAIKELLDRVNASM